MFERASLDTRIWDVVDPGSHLSLGAGGLTVSGGTGADGQTMLTANDQVEMGGTLVIEAADVRFGIGSDGVLGGLYAGPVARTNCFAGFNVRQSGGDTVVTPLVNGAEAGTTYRLVDGHRYTLRIRLHSPEIVRVLQTYYARVDGDLESFGGGLVDSPMALVFEVRDMGNASNTPATVLYDGDVTSSPASCSFAAVNSIGLNGSVGSCTVRQEGSTWVTSGLPDGSRTTRLVGIAGEGVDCEVQSAGKVTFFAGRVPVAGEIVTISYRMRNRAVARLQDAASVAAEAAGGMPGTARWLGKVVRPKARCSVDCESASQAVLSLATSRAAAMAGSYIATNPAEDVWPGDVLRVTANGATLNVVVRRVTIADEHAAPEWMTYRIAFANDWAECLGITLSESIAADAFVPETALDAPGVALANLAGLKVVSATGTELQVDAGCDAPAGGGFEVRRRDWNFAAGAGADLVLRSPVRNFSIPRAAQLERYYVRMYDGSDPPLYSRLSSAFFVNLPVG